MLSNHIKQDIFFAFQTGDCLLLHESSAESRSFLRYFHSTLSNHLSVAISVSPEWTGVTVCISLLQDGSSGPERGST